MDVAALTNALRTTAINRVRHTGPPFAGPGAPFILTRNPRHGNGGRNSKLFRFLFL